MRDIFFFFMTLLPFQICYDVYGVIAKKKKLSQYKKEWVGQSVSEVLDKPIMMGSSELWT